jgi:hypothetical protein
MKIACIGNCQLESLAWYIKYLLPNDECWWVSFDKKRYKGYNFNDKLKEVNGELLTKDFIDNVRCPHNEIDYIKSCDYIIYLKMTENSSTNYHTKKLKTYFRDGSKSIFVANYYIDTDKYTESLEGTIKREKSKGVDIGIDKIINQDNKNEMLPIRKHEPNHPPSNYFLKLLGLICEHFDWEYFSKEDHDMFLKTGFPHGVNSA